MYRKSHKKSNTNLYTFLATVVLTLGVVVTTYAVMQQTNPESEAKYSKNGTGKSSRSAKVSLVNGSGEQIGTVTLKTENKGTRVRVSVEKGLTPGYHGFHVHSVGQCVAPFTTSGGHLATVVTTTPPVSVSPVAHPNHVGDMPSLLVAQDGTAKAEFVTTRFTVSSLYDADGSAFIVHGGPDNYANIPADRYDPDADEATLKTGDAGARVACGVVMLTTDSMKQGTSEDVDD